MGLGVVLLQLSCYPLVFLICDCAASPSTASTSGFCTLTGWVSMSVSSLLVYSSGWVGGVLLRPLPQGLQRTLFSLLLVPLGFSGLLLLRLLAGVVGLCTLCQGAPIAVLSTWFAGGVPLLPFPSLEWVCFWLRCLQSLWAAKAVLAALRGSSSSSCVCWSFTFFWS